MNISDYAYDACQEIWEIVAGVHSMLIARSDQEIARQNDDVCCGAFVCYYATKILSYDSCLFPPNFTIHDTLRPDQRNMSNVSSLSSPIANFPTNTPPKRGRKKKSDVEKADYKKRHITYNKKRNF